MPSTYVAASSRGDRILHAPSSLVEETFGLEAIIIQAEFTKHIHSLLYTPNVVGITFPRIASPIIILPSEVFPTKGQMKVQLAGFPTVGVSLCCSAGS